MSALKYLGVILLIIGVIILAVPYLTSGNASNMVLIIGIVLIVAGYLSHIFLNRKFE